MNRRGFFASLAAFVAAPSLAKDAPGTLAPVLFTDRPGYMVGLDAAGKLPPSVLPTVSYDTEVYADEVMAMIRSRAIDIGVARMVADEERRMAEWFGLPLNLLEAQ